jgi:hypothetical protein
MKTLIVTVAILTGSAMAAENPNISKQRAEQCQAKVLEAFKTITSNQLSKDLFLAILGLAAKSQDTTNQQLLSAALQYFYDQCLKEGLEVKTGKGPY